MIVKSWLRILCLAFFTVYTCPTSVVTAQDLPKEIRGYKVKTAKIEITNSSSARTGEDIRDAKVTVGDPEIVDVALSGVTFQVSAEFEPRGVNGRVDFLTFHNIRVNGLAVQIDEYKEKFDFKSNQVLRLPKPATVFLRSDQMMRAAWKEFRESKDDWTVTGRVFVFGRFRKFGFDFKRVIPVDINIKIKNPLMELKSAANRPPSQTAVHL